MSSHSKIRGAPPPKPIPIKDRTSIVFVEKGQLDVLDGAFVLVDVNGVRTHIPIGGLVCIMLEPGARVSHAAIVLAARVGTLLMWVGEAGVRLYATGQPGGARSDKLLWQCRLALDSDARLKIVRKMYSIRFGGKAPQRRSVDQLRGIEGARVRALYQKMAQQFGVPWKRRNYDPSDWNFSDVPNRCLSSANACLYGITEAAILAAGYAPAIGFMHTGKPLSFVYDIADLFKFETVIPEAFRIAGQYEKGVLGGIDPVRAVRLACRDSFRKTNLLKKLIPVIEDVLAAGELTPPDPPEEAIGPAFPDPPSNSDAGHRG